MPNHDKGRDTTTRRKWLKYTGLIPITGVVAGCSSDGDGSGGGDGQNGETVNQQPKGANTGTSGQDGSDGSDGETQGGGDGGSDEILDRTFRHHTYVPPDDTNLNPFSPKSGWHNRLYSNRMLSLWDSTRGELSAANGIGMAEDWGFRTTDGTPEFYVTIVDGWKWSAGPEADSGLDNSDVVAEDIVKQSRLNRLMTPEEERAGNPIVTDWYAEDKKTAVFELEKGRFNRVSTRINNLTQWFWTDVHRDGPLGKYADKLRETKESGRGEIREEVIQSTEMSILQKPVSGPWRPIDANKQRIQFELNRNDVAAAPQGGPLNFSNFELVWLGDTSFVRAMAEDEISAHQDPVPVGASPPDNLHEIDAAELGGSMINIRNFPEDHENAFMNEPKFRWAIAHIIDKGQAAENAGRLVQPVQKQTADEDAQAKAYIPDLYEKLRAYEVDHDKAAQYLEDIGCTKEGGNWIDPNGNSLSLPILSIDTGLWQPQARTVANNLKNFGFDVKLTLQDETTVASRTENKDYTVFMHKWGGFAYYPLNFDWGWEEAGDNEDINPDVHEVPAPIGDYEGSEGTMEVNGPELYAKVQETSDPAKAKEMAKKMCWAFHYDLPWIQIASSGSGTPINTNGKWNWPEYNEGHGTSEEWSTWITEGDDPLWAVDAPENAIIHGHGPGPRANPDYEG